MGFQFDRLPGNGGIVPRTIECHLVAHGTVTAGTVYTVDTTFDPVATNGVAFDSAAAVDGAIEGTQWVMALESGVIGDTLRFLIQGFTTILLNDGTNIVADDKLASDGSGAVLAAVANDVIIAIAPAAELGTATPAWFDGRGLGLKGA